MKLIFKYEIIFKLLIYIKKININKSKKIILNIILFIYK